jgi:DNA-binding PadR family transcriptional regulator
MLLLTYNWETRKLTIEYTILGLLSQEPMSGYDLKKIISGSPTFYWSGNSNQIYSVLVELHRQGYLSLEVIYQENKPPRKIYTITALGKQKLAAWLQSSPQLPERKHPFLIQLAWANLLPDTELDGLLERYQEEIQAQLKMAQHHGLSLEPVAPLSGLQELIWEQISQNWTAYYQAELQWLQAFRSKLKDKEGSL